jgi:TPR repeat protein
MYEISRSAFPYKATVKTWYRRAAEQVHIEAQKILDALCYMEKSDWYPHALEWYLKAAEQDAQYKFEQMYNDGQGQPSGQWQGDGVVRQG